MPGPGHWSRVLFLPLERIIFSIMCIKNFVLLKQHIGVFYWFRSTQIFEITGCRKCYNYGCLIPRVSPPCPPLLWGKHLQAHVHVLFQDLGTLNSKALSGVLGNRGIYFREQRSKMRGTKAILWNSSLVNDCHPGEWLSFGHVTNNTSDSDSEGNKAIYFRGTRLGGSQFCKSCV